MIRSLVVCLGVCLLSSVSVAGPAETGWTHLLNNRFDSASVVFKSVKPEDPGYSRALLGQYFLQNLMKQHDKAFQSFLDFTKTVSDPNPYVYSSWINESFLNNRSRRQSAFPALLQRMIEKPDSLGLYRAFAYSNLGEWYLETGEISQAEAQFKKVATVDDWMITGPFDNISGSGHEKVYGPENGFEATDTFTGLAGIPVKWMKIPVLRRDRWVDFTLYFGQAKAIYYANTFVFSESDQTVHFRVGTSGSLKVFLNDHVIISVPDEFNNDQDTYIAQVDLKKGWNRLLVKVGASEITRNNFMLRITDKAGFPVPTININTLKKNYTPGPAVVSQVPSFTESWFYRKVADHPSVPENYLFLAEVLLRNDKAPEAEAVLEKGLKQFPESILFYDRLTEALVRGKKYDEYNTIYTRFEKMGVVFPDLVTYRYYRASRNQNWDAAREHLNTLKKLVPNSESYYSLLIDYYSDRNMKEELISTSLEAVNKFPHEWNYYDTWATTQTQTSQGVIAALEKINNFLRLKKNTGALITKAALNFRLGNQDAFDDAMEDLIEFDPASPSNWYTWGSLYFYVQKYEKSEEKIRKALSIAPQNDDYLGSLGEILRVQGKTAEAKKYFSEAILYNPVAYSYREKLLELEGKESAFTNFSTWNLDSIIRQAPDYHSDYSEGALILVDDTRRVVYPNGASEAQVDMVIKVYTDRGVERFKDYYIEFNPSGEELTIEKKVVIKPNGDEIQADNNNNHVVFKSLQPGDIIHLRWKVQYYYRGKLSEHFWESVNLNYYYPVANLRYSLKTPEGFKFNYRAFKGAPEPATWSVAGGKITEWVVRNEPGIAMEANSPPLSDIGKRVEISSLPDWGFIVNWYLDLTANKTRMTPELREALAEIFPGGVTGSPEQKLKAIHYWVTENIKYSSESFRQSGHIPQIAREVCATRIGDCKDMATLAIALLREAGVPAWYVLVNTWDEGLNEQALPSIDFNHAIVAAELPSGMQYVDMTGANYSVGTVPYLDQGAFFLLIKPGTTDPGYLKPSWFDQNTIQRNLDIQVMEDGKLKIREESVRTGSLTGRLRSGWRDLTEKERRDQFVKNNTEYKNLQIDTLIFGDLSKLDSVVKTTYIFSAGDWLTSLAGFQAFRIPWSSPFDDGRFFGTDRRKNDLIYHTETDQSGETLVISFPGKMKPIEIPKNVSLTSPIGTYSLTFKMDKGKLVINRLLKLTQTRISTTDYPAVRTFFKEIEKADATQLLLK